MSLIVNTLALPEIKEIIPARFGDHRGYFTESYNQARFVENGIDYDWVQDNHSFSKERGVVRGLHYQIPPVAQDKLVRVVTGEVLDVAVDIRKGSPTFGKWVSLVLSADKGNQILVPAGFAHGFMTLTPDVHMVYKVSAPYSAAHDRSIRFDDPEIAIDWPVEGAPHISQKDEAAPWLKDADTGFVFDDRAAR